MIRQIARLMSNADGRRLLWMHGLRAAARPVDQALASILRRRLGSVETNEYRPPILIVGPPRSGTTLIYQYLVAALELSYIHNRWSIWPQSAPYRRAIVGQVPQVSFESFYGNGVGPAGVNEGGSIFDLWMPRQDTDALEQIDDETARSMRRYIQVSSRCTGLPLLLKNGRNAVRLPALWKAWPGFTLVRVRRQLSHVARSILRGRSELAGSLDDNWTVLPAEWPALANLSPIKQVAAQAFFLERAVDRAVEALPSNRIIEIDYSEFCAAPAALAQRVAIAAGVHFRVDIWPQVESKTFRYSERHVIEDEVGREIASMIRDLESADDPMDVVVLHAQGGEGAP